MKRNITYTEREGRLYPDLELPEQKEIIAATCTYGAELPVALSHKNIFATQFHPEKSGDVGLAILKNFLTTGGNE